MFSHHWLTDAVTIDWTRVAARRNEIVGTSGDDDLRGTEGDDSFLAYQGGTDHLQGLGGDDRFIMGTFLDRGDRIDGGAGFDNVNIQNDFDENPHIVITGEMFKGVEKLTLNPSESFDVELRNGLTNLKVVAPGPGTLVFDASALRTGSVNVIAGARDDVVVGSHLDDRILGGGGGDTLTGGAGNDRFRYPSKYSSLTDRPDQIMDFSGGDVLVLPKLADNQAYHFGDTSSHIGDIMRTYDAESGRTALSIFTDGDSNPDMLIYLSGDLTFEVVHDSRLILA